LLLAAPAWSRPLFCARKQPVKPVLQALLVADHIYEDKATGKKIIVGIFNRVFFKKEPEQGAQKQEEQSNVIMGGMHIGSPYAYLNITDVHGQANLELRYVDLSDHSVIFKTHLPVVCPDPLATVEFILAMPPLPTPHAGVFALELLADGEPMGAHRISVEELPAEERNEYSRTQPDSTKHQPLGQTVLALSGRTCL
jgi:hypothetical protein